MTRTLFIAPQWIGDAVMTEPLLRELHRQGEQITVAALSWVAPVYQHMDSVVNILELPFVHGKLQWAQRSGLARQWRGMFDRAYVAPNSFKSALLPWMAGIPERIGYHGEARYGVLTKRLPNPDPDKHPPMVPFYFALSGQPAPKDKTLMPLLQRSSEEVRQTLVRFGLRAGEFTVMVPGVEYGPAKMWPAANVADLCRILDGKKVLLGSPKETELCQSICDVVNDDKLVNFAGQTNLSQALDILSVAKAVVSNDSGLCHVSAALGVPQVVIYGSTSPRHAPPLNDKAQLIWLGDDQNYTPALECAPCCERICRYGHTRCMADVKAERVAKLLQSL